jgi:hypothetical protein
VSETKQAGIYLYAIVSADRGQSFPVMPSGGVGGGEVFPIVEHDLAAIVGRTQQDRIRPERRYVGAHQAILKLLTATESALPISFGMIASSEEAVRGILRKHRDVLRSQLDHVAGKIEMGLRVSWDVPNIFEHFVGHFPELKASRDALVEAGQGSRDQMIEIGQLFESRLTSERDHAYRRVAEVLKSYDIEVKRNPTRVEREVLNLACLIDRDKQSEFETVVCEAARGFDNSFLFDFNGPWSPYNFVDIRLKQPD